MEGPKLDIDPKKCYSCGKVFSKPAELQRHKNRKTPCLIREVPAGDVLNPLRCIYCNKIFSNKSNLTKHSGTCKIKNGGMDILDEKVRYEQEIRVLKEQRDADAKKLNEHANLIKEMLETQGREKQEMQEMREQIKLLQESAKTPVVQNIVNNGTINNFYNYNTPFADPLVLTQDDLLVENIAKRMVEMVYFNNKIPNNHTVYLPNINEKRLLVYSGGAWNHVGAGSLNDTIVQMKNASRLIGINKVNNIYSSDEEFEKLYPVVREAIDSYNSGGAHAKCSNDEVFEIIRSKRELIKLTIDNARIAV